MAEPAKLERFHADGVGRVNAFSDGVFAIAMTLLVLNFRTPDLSGGDLDHKLYEFVKDDYELLLSYGLSAFVISRYWLAHHRLFRLMRRSDPVVLELNLVVLALVALVPYPTELLGRYGETTTAAVAYAATVAAAGLANSAPLAPRVARRPARPRRLGELRAARPVPGHEPADRLRAVDPDRVRRPGSRRALLAAAVWHALHRAPPLGQHPPPVRVLTRDPARGQRVIVAVSSTVPSSATARSVRRVPRTSTAVKWCRTASAFFVGTPVHCARGR